MAGDGRPGIGAQKEIAARTVDCVIPGDERSERDHKLQGEGSGAADIKGYKWRHATDGGWFSWHLKVLPNGPQQLRVAYWGSDGGREFDILVDGAKIAVQKLESKCPNKLFDVLYTIPAELLKNRTTVTVRFQAKPNGMAGGVFGCRIVKAR